jgi:hypothetical protein
LKSLPGKIRENAPEALFAFLREMLGNTQYVIVQIHSRPQVSQFTLLLDR